MHDEDANEDSMVGQPGRLDVDSLEISHGDQIIVLDGSRSVITIGRGADCDLVIDEPPVSRSHARLELRGGTFAFVDHSTNGSFVLSRGREWIPVHRAERPLQGSGVVVLGPDREGTSVFHYRTLDLDATLPSAS